MFSITLFVVFATFLIVNAQDYELKFEIPNFFGMPIKELQQGNYFKAIQICQLMGMQVVTPDIPEKNVAAIKFMKENGLTDMWTSGNDLGDEGNYNWILSGKLLNYTSWSTGQPDNAGNIEDCIQIWFRNDVYKWNDLPCTATLSIVCETKPEPCFDLRGNFLTNPSPA